MKIIQVYKTNDYAKCFYNTSIKKRIRQNYTKTIKNKRGSQNVKTKHTYISLKELQKNTKMSKNTIWL